MRNVRGGEWMNEKGNAKFVNTTIKKLKNAVGDNKTYGGDVETDVAVADVSLSDDGIVGGGEGGGSGEDEVD